MAFIASQFANIESALKNEPIYMCIVSVLIELRINFFLAEGQGVHGDLHPGNNN